MAHWDDFIKEEEAIIAYNEKRVSLHACVTVRLLNKGKIEKIEIEKSDNYNVKLESDIVMYQDQQLIYIQNIYLVLHKPSGYVTTLSDEHGRRKVIDLFEKEDLDKRIFPVGRLDYDTQGVLLFTNDGELANLLMHPSSNVDKVYVAKINGVLTGMLNTAYTDNVISTSWIKAITAATP